MLHRSEACGPEYITFLMQCHRNLLPFGVSLKKTFGKTHEAIEFSLEIIGRASGKRHPEQLFWPQIKLLQSSIYKAVDLLFFQLWIV